MLIVSAKTCELIESNPALLLVLTVALYAKLLQEGSNLLLIVRGRNEWTSHCRETKGKDEGPRRVQFTHSRSAYHFAAMGHKLHAVSRFCMQ